MEEGFEKTGTEGSFLRLREKYVYWLTVAVANNAEFVSAQRGQKGGPGPE